MTGYGAYRDVFGVDSEWGFSEGRVDHESAFVPVVFCAVGYYEGSRLVFWGRDPRLATFVLERSNALFIAHNAVAEIKYLMRAGIPVPDHWYDTFMEERYRTNQPNPPRVSLSAALHRRGLPHLAPQVKEELRQRILNLQFDINDPDTRAEISDYCLSDCDGCLALFRAQTESA